MHAYLQSIRRKNPEGVLLLNAGDSYQGSLVSNTSRGQAVASLFRLLQVDASTIGNHEFDWGGLLAITQEQQADYESPFLRVVEKSTHPFLAHNMLYQKQH